MAHIDPAGAGTIIYVVHGVKVFLLATPRNASAFSMNAEEGHVPSNYNDSLLYQAVTVKARSYL